MNTDGLYFEEHEVGASFTTLARTVTEADICAFVNLCGLNEPLFYDMEFVQRESVFPARPAPGAMTFALSEGLVMQTGLIHGTGMSYLGSDIRIVKPVVVNDTIRVRIVVSSTRETSKPDRGIVTYEHTVTNQRGEVVLEAVVKRMIKRRAA
jgi:acyl dehydratase